MICGQMPEIRKIEGHGTVRTSCPRNCFCEMIIAYIQSDDKSKMEAERMKITRLSKWQSRLEDGVIYFMGSSFAFSAYVTEISSRTWEPRFFKVSLSKSLV